VLVGLAEEVDLAVGDAEAGGQHALHGHVAIVEPAPEEDIGEALDWFVSMQEKGSEAGLPDGWFSSKIFQFG
jgi:hypothetical protein